VGYPINRYLVALAWGLLFDIPSSNAHPFFFFFFESIRLINLRLSGVF